MIRRVRIMSMVLLAASFMLGAGGQNAVAKQAAEPAAVYDPIEPVNRFIFGFNDILDRILLGPVSRVYHAVLPDFMENVVRDFTRNLKSPLIMANEALQGDGDGFGRAFGRMMINTTVGLGGMIDVAGMHGMPYEAEDFGQTLGVWGAPVGPYLVLPVLGPSSVRDTAGMVTDYVVDPVRISADATQRDEDLQWVRIFGAIDGRARKEALLADLRRNSVDYYATMRSMYLQSRAAAIQDGAGTADIPDYDEETP